MIKVITSATEIPELMFMATSMGIKPYVTDSFFLGIGICGILAKESPDKKFALFDSNDLLHVVEYEELDNLKDYLDEHDFEVGYTVGIDGVGTLIK